MDNENIKEILDFLDDDNRERPFGISNHDLKILRDYITNLQEENERLKENAIHNDKVVDKAKWNEMLYKSRNEKAIEYMNNYIKVEESNEPVKIEFKVVRNILQGEDKDVNTTD